MSAIGQRLKILCFFIVLILPHASRARYRRFYPYKLDLLESVDSTTTGPIFKKSNAEFLIIRLIDVLNRQQDELINKTRSRCLRLFGSIYGTRDEKIRCLEKLKKDRAEKKRLQALLKDDKLLAAVYKTPFTDFTRVSEDYAGLGLGALKSALLRPKGDVRFSRDYIDFSELRTRDQEAQALEGEASERGIMAQILRRLGQELSSKQLHIDALENLEYPNMDRFSTDYIDFAELRTRPDSPSNFTSYRKSRHHSSKKKKNLKRSRDSSSDEDSSETKTVSIKWLKPKRFQVIRNINNVNNPISIVASEETVQIEPKKHKKNKKNSKKHKHKSKKHAKVINEDSDEVESKKDSDSASSETKKKEREDYEEYIKSSSSIEYTEPIKTFDKLETYLQGNRFLQVNTKDGRKRMRGFLPKRFRWNEDEIHHLGYYWFDGLQGKYALFPSRT